MKLRSLQHVPQFTAKNQILGEGLSYMGDKGMHGSNWSSRLKSCRPKFIVMSPKILLNV